MSQTIVCLLGFVASLNVSHPKDQRLTDMLAPTRKQRMNDSTTAMTIWVLLSFLVHCIY